MMTPDSTLFERVGGRDFFVRLIERFYESVAVDPVLRPIYPEDLEPPKAHLAGFLAQYWGGPPQYTAERGSPRLRMRHAPFAIGREERDIWVRHMRAALESVDVSAEDAAQLSEYFEDTATFLMNRP